MSKTFNFEVQKRPTRKGTFPIYIRITEDRKSKKIKTSVELNKLSDWNPKAKDDKHIRTSELNHSHWNDILANELESAKNMYRDNKELSLDSLTQSIKQKDVSASFIEFTRTKVEEMRSVGSIGTYRHYKTTIQKLEEYLKSEKKDDVLFSEVNLAFLKGFESFLGKVENGRESGRTLGRSTMNNYLKKLRTLVNCAVKEDLIPNDKNPYLRFSIKQDSQSAKEKLEVAELERMIALDLNKGSDEWHTRNVFLFSFFCAGMRVGDVLQLRWENVIGGRLNYQMDKTSKRKNIELVEDAKRILAEYRTKDSRDEEYIFPLLDSRTIWARESHKGKSTMSEELQKALFNQISSKTVVLNRTLKKIAIKAKIKKNLTMHVARHTFANLAMKSNMQSATIRDLLGHSSVRTTEGYMGNFSNSENDKALRDVFSGMEGVSLTEMKNALLAVFSISVIKPSERTKKALFSALNGADKEIIVNALMGLISK